MSGSLVPSSYIIGTDRNTLGIFQKCRRPTVAVPAPLVKRRLKLSETLLTDSSCYRPQHAKIHQIAGTSSPFCLLFCRTGQRHQRPQNVSLPRKDLPMTWRQIEQKWTDMAVRLQAAPPTSHAGKVPSGGARNRSPTGIAGNDGRDHSIDNQTINSPAMV